jgi:hypothetical protein
VNGFEQRLKDKNLERADRQRIEDELKAFRAQVCNKVTIKPVTYRNPESQEDEAGAEVYLDGSSDPLGWITQEDLPAVTHELRGVLVSGGQYSLKVLCPMVAENKRLHPLDAHVPPQNGHRLSLDVVNGWYSKFYRGIPIAADLENWKAQAGRPATLRPTTYEQAGIAQPAVAVYVDGYAGQFGWITKAQVPAVKGELRGILARDGEYSLKFFCDQAV